MEPAITDRGRGPEISGSRITVYDVLAETTAGTTPEEMALWWQLDVEQILLALRYIEAHREEVEADWAAIRSRHAQGNPAHVRAMLEGRKERLEKLRAELRGKKQAQGNGDAGVAGGH